MLSLEAPSGLLFNPNVKKFMNIRYDEMGKMLGRSVLGNQDEFIRHKKQKSQTKSAHVKKGMTVRPSHGHSKNTHASNQNINSNESEFSTGKKSKTMRNGPHNHVETGNTNPSM